MTILGATSVVTPSGTVAPGEVEVVDGRIVAVRPATGEVPERTLVPGFVDLQVNGHDDVDVAHADGADWDRLDELLLAQGVTAWCPTFVTAPLDTYAAPLGRMQEHGAQGGVRPLLVGAHLEGPFLGECPGAHPPELLRPLDLPWLERVAPAVKVVTLGPELDGALGAIRSLAARGVLVALGHSAVSYEGALAAIGAGARLVTHAFNGMPPLHHREPGLLGAALTDDRVAISLIADLVHVHPVALALAVRAKRAPDVVLVTDAVAWRAGHVGDLPLSLEDGAPRLPDGTLAGSALTMDAAVRNLVHVAGVPLEAAVRAASTNPARLLGLGDRGEIAVGYRADLVALDPALEITTTWVDGDPAYDSGPHR